MANLHLIIPGLNVLASSIFNAPTSKIMVVLCYLRSKFFYFILPTTLIALKLASWSKWNIIDASPL